MDNTRDFIIYKTEPCTGITNGEEITDLSELEIDRLYILDFTVWVKRHTMLQNEHSIELISEPRLIDIDESHNEAKVVELHLDIYKNFAERVSRLDDLNILCRFVSREDDEEDLIPIKLNFKQY